MYEKLLSQPDRLMAPVRSEFNLQATTINNIYQKIQNKTVNWRLRDWIPFSILLQIIFVTFIQLLWWIWPATHEEPPILKISTDMSFLEFETKTEEVARTKDLSDEVLEVEQLTDDRKVNWNNAVDPTFDFSQRYKASLEIRNANAEFPQSATGANLGRIFVDVRIYIDANSRIRDVRILRLRSSGNTHKAFEKEFRSAARRVILKRTRLRNQPYRVGGVAKDFVWETSIEFSMQ